MTDAAPPRLHAGPGALERDAGGDRPHRASGSPRACTSASDSRRCCTSPPTSRPPPTRRWRCAASRTTSCRSGWSRSARACPGYVTPKVAIGAIVGNDAGEILLVKRPDSGIWLYPTGWADVGYSPAEVAVKEVYEETGIECEPVQLLVGRRRPADGLHPVRHVHGAVPLPRRRAATLQGHPLETAGVGWFARDELPASDGGRGVVGPDGVRRDRRPATGDAVRRPVARARCWRRPRVTPD